MWPLFNLVCTSYMTFLPQAEFGFRGWRAKMPVGFRGNRLVVPVESYDLHGHWATGAHMGRIARLKG
jgi:hypothetical protein